VLVLTDAADQAVAVRGQPVDGRPQVVDLEGHVALPQLAGHRGGTRGLVVSAGVVRVWTVRSAAHWRRRTAAGTVALRPDVVKDRRRTGCDGAVGVLSAN
jgi:hypothetical protein